MTSNRLQVYGITIDADFSFDALSVTRDSGPSVPSDEPAPVLSISRADVDHGTKPPILELGQPRDGRSPYRLFSSEAGPIVSVTGVGEFLVGESRIWYRPVGEVDNAFRACVLGQVLGLWLELSGRLVFHGASIVVGGRAVGILGLSGRGKSTLAMEFMCRGFEVLGDDKLVVHLEGGRVNCRPAAPWVNVFPDVYEVVNHPRDRQPGVADRGGKVQIDIRRRPSPESAVPLASLFVLDSRRSGQKPRLATVASEEALIELVRHSFMVRTISALGLESARLPRLAHIVRLVGFRRLSLVEGFAELPTAVRLIERFVLESAGPSDPPTVGHRAPSQT